MRSRAFLFFLRLTDRIMDFRKIDIGLYGSNYGPLFWRVYKRSKGWINFNRDLEIPPQPAHGKSMTLAEFKKLLHFEEDGWWEVFAREVFLPKLVSLGLPPDPLDYIQSCQPIKHGDTGVPWFRVTYRGDQFLPFEFFIYWDRVLDKAVPYLPLRGNLLTLDGKPIPAQRVYGERLPQLPDASWDYILGPAWGGFEEKDLIWVRPRAKEACLQQIMAVDRQLIIEEFYQALIRDERTRNN